MSAKSTGTLIAGLLLIAAGALFLLVNLSIFNINWVIALETVFPALFIYFGFIKLFRHYSWDREKILQKPAKAGLLGGLFWFSLGVILLLDILDILKTLEVIGTYWPVILILFGLLKILDYYRFGGALQVRTGEVFGVVFLIFFGIGAHQLAKAHFALFDEFHLGGFKWPVMVPGDEQKYQFESEKTVALSDVEMIEVVNLYGDLKVFPNGDDSLEIQLEKIIRGETEKDAQKIADSVEIITRLEGNILRVQTNREALQERGRKLNTHLSLQLPSNLPVTLKNRYGDVQVEKRSAACKVENSYGIVKVRLVSGDLEIVNRYRPVEVRQSQGKLKVINRRGSVRLEEITGDTEVKTDYEGVVARIIEGNIKVENHFGSIRVEDIKGSVDIEGPGSRIDLKRISQPVSVKNSHKTITVRELEDRFDLETSYSRVNLEQIQGPVTLQAAHSTVSSKQLFSGIKLDGRGSGVSLNQIQGPVEVVTSLRQVRIDGFLGPANVRNEYGKIVIVNDRAPAGLITAFNTNGEIDLYLPQSAQFEISAEAYSGSIESDFSGLEPKSEENASVLETRIGDGGPKVELKTSHSRIRIMKRG